MTDEQCLISFRIKNMSHMKKATPLYIFFTTIILSLFMSCGETDTNTIVWSNKAKGIKKMEKVTTDGITTITHFYADGMKKKQEEFKGIERHGKSYRWYENGVLEQEKIFEHGRKVGVHKRYYNNGQLSAQLQYSKGQKEGVWSYYLNNGEKWRIETYNAGSLASAERF